MLSCCSRRTSTLLSSVEDAKALEMPNIEIRIKPSDSSIAFKNFLIDPPLLFLKSIFNFLSLIIRPPYNEITLEYIYEDSCIYSNVGT